MQLILIELKWRNERNYHRKQTKRSEENNDNRIHKRQTENFKNIYQLNRGQLYAPVDMTIVYLCLFDLITTIYVQIIEYTHSASYTKSATF